MYSTSPYGAAYNMTARLQMAGIQKGWIFMKNLRKIAGIALVLVVGLALTTCDNGTTGGDPGGPTFLGEELELSGQVYQETQNQNTGAISYTPYNSSLMINNFLGGIGGVTNGQLTYSVTGAPSGVVTFTTPVVASSFGSGYTNVHVNDQTVQGLIFHYLPVSGGGDLSYTKMTISGSGYSYSFAFEGVSYAYVDKDVTISGTGTTETGIDNDYGETTHWTDKTNNFSLELKAGWNAICTKRQVSATYTPTNNTYNETYTETMSLGNPSLRWVYDDGSNYGNGSMAPRRSFAPALEKLGLKK